MLFVLMEAYLSHADVLTPTPVVVMVLVWLKRMVEGAVVAMTLVCVYDESVALSAGRKSELRLEC